MGIRGGGRRLIAKSFGLGKTHDQVEIMRLIHEREQRSTLIVCPLGAKHQFVDEDGPRLGVDFQYVRDDAEVKACQTPFMVTNYERIREGNISAEPFVAVSLDEGSVLRSLGSKTRLQFVEQFKHTPYRFICTATPCSNQYDEMLTYADFLGIMDMAQGRTRWLQRDVNRAGKLFSLNSVYNFDTHVDIGEALEDEGRLPSHFMMLNPQSYVPYAWTDANLMSTLNSKQRQKRQENHLCPLPFDLVRRVIERFSNEGELIFEPFGGLMTVPYVALELGRNAYACELNPEYWAAGVDYLQMLEQKLSAPTLFDFLQDAGKLQPVETEMAA